MSTRDLTGTTAPAGAPAEVQQPPTPTEALGYVTPVPTPGIAMAAARVPGTPTMPDWDPASLTLAIGKMASEMFSMPPIFDVSAHPPHALSPAPMNAPNAPAVSAPAEQPSGGATMPTPADPVPASVAPASAASTSPTTPSAPNVDNPFFVAPRFDEPSLDFLPPELMRLPLVDAPAIPTAPLPAIAPSWPAPALDPTIDAQLAPASGAFDAYAIRAEFPILKEIVNGRPLVWLDNAATTQKPQAVIDRLTYFYEHENSNIHRAAHALAARATDAYEAARKSVRRFLNAPTSSEIVFVRGATEGLNFIAQTWGKTNLRAGDEVLITWLEHHANIVPWKRLCDELGATLRVAPVDDTGQIILEQYERLLTPAVKLVSIPQVSNALGTVTPTRQMIEIAHRHGAVVVVDGAQAVSHMPVDVQELDCDFYVFSGHKVFAPTGIGVVFGKAAILESLPPWQGGGNMIEDVRFDQIRYQPPPMRFEAGTGNIADAVGLGAALDWLSRVGLPNVSRHEHDLLVYATERLMKIPGLAIIGTAADKAGVVSFIIAGHKTEEISTYLDQQGIAVRGGHHCAQPILRRFGLESTVRASFAPYNVCEDVDALADALLRLVADRGHRR